MIHLIYKATDKVTACKKQLETLDKDPGHEPYLQGMEVATPIAFSCIEVSAIESKEVHRKYDLAILEPCKACVEADKAFAAQARTDGVNSYQAMLGRRVAR
jgi:hypothetical protein